MNQEVQKPEGQDNPNIIQAKGEDGNGRPFKTEAAARSARAAKGLHPDEWDVRPIEGNEVGFVLAKKLFGDEPTKTGTVASIGVDKKEAKGEEYHWVRFHDKTNEQDPDDVVLGVNGEVLLIQRNEWVILPHRFLVCAENAVHPHFKQLPGHPRKQVGTIRTWPHDTKAEPATREQFLEMKRLGTAANRKAIEAARIA